MPKKQFSEEFKKKTIKNMIRFGLTKKEAAHKVKVTETALGYWEDKYYYEAMQELEEEKRQKKRHADGKIKREVLQDIMVRNKNKLNAYKIRVKKY